MEKAPLSKNEMEALITNQAKEYVWTNTWWYKFCWETAFYLIYFVNYYIYLDWIDITHNIHLSVYSACKFTKTGPNFSSFWWFQNLAGYTNTYMLEDQPFLIDSAMFLSQCNRMTILLVFILVPFLLLPYGILHTLVNSGMMHTRYLFLAFEAGFYLRNYWRADISNTLKGDTRYVCSGLVLGKSCFFCRPVVCLVIILPLFIAVRF